MYIKNLPGLIYKEDTGNAQFKEVFHLEIHFAYPRAFVGKYGIRDRIHALKQADHARSVRHHRKDFGIHFLEGWIVMAQLHHMVNAVRSGKADIKHQQCVGLM